MFQIEFRFLAIKNIKKRKLRMRFEIVLQISKNYYQLFVFYLLFPYEAQF